MDSHPAGHRGRSGPGHGQRAHFVRAWSTGNSLRTTPSATKTGWTRMASPTRASSPWSWSSTILQLWPRSRVCLQGRLPAWPASSLPTGRRVALVPAKGGLLNGTANGLYTAMAIHCLNALVGSIETPGGVQVQRYFACPGWPELPPDPVAEQGRQAERVDGAGTVFPLARHAYQAVADRILDGYPVECSCSTTPTPCTSAPTGQAAGRRPLSRSTPSSPSAVSSTRRPSTPTWCCPTTLSWSAGRTISWRGWAIPGWPCGSRSWSRSTTRATRVMCSSSWRIGWEAG